MKRLYILPWIAAFRAAAVVVSGGDACPVSQKAAVQGEFTRSFFNYGVNTNFSQQTAESTLQRAATIDFNQDGTYWVVFIHGGAWRSGSGLDFLCAVANMSLSRDEAPFDKIRGFATIDYRLSPLGNGEEESGRTARHPDHINDVRSAIQSLAQRVQMDKYILIGHSAGGTMAMQLLMGDAALQRTDTDGDGDKQLQRKRRQEQPSVPSSPPPSSSPSTSCHKTATEENSIGVPLPEALITTAGIFDLPLLVESIGPEKKAFYTQFVEQAFGRNRDGWALASPARFGGSFAQMWPGSSDGGKVVLLARSAEDTLVDVSQLQVMKEKLVGDGIAPIIVGDLKGQHDMVWEDGGQLASLVKRTLHELDARSKHV